MDSERKRKRGRGKEIGRKREKEERWPDDHGNNNDCDDKVAPHSKCVIFGIF